MNIALIEKTTACCREIFHQIKSVQEQADCIVPDTLEDVGQIVSARAQICLKRKDVLERSVEIGAEAQISVFYITESRDRVRCMSFSRDLDISFDSSQIEPDCTAQLSLCSMGAQARAVNPRKISVQLNVRAELICWTESSFRVPEGIAEAGERGLQLRQSRESCVLTAQTSEKSFAINEQFSFDGQEDVTSLSSVCAKLLFLEHQPIGSKVLIKGAAELSVAYETQDTLFPRFLERQIPFSVLIDMPNEDCSLGSVTLVPTAVYADLGEAINGSRVCEFELHGTAQAVFERSEETVFLSDAYSTLCPTSVSVTPVPVCRCRRSESLAAETSERMHIDRDRGEVVCVFYDVLSFAAHDEKAELSASLSLLLRSDDGSFSAQQRLLPFEAPLPEKGGEITAFRITDLIARREGEEIAVSLSGVLDCSRRELVELPCLSSVELDTENAFDASSLPSVTLTRRGEGELWELAKLYHSSVEAIEQTQRDYQLPEDLLLIPRL